MFAFFKIKTIFKTDKENICLYSQKINKVLGNLRRRTTELLQGDYSRGFRDELPYVKAYIEFFSPEEILKALKPIYDDLASIDDKIYTQVSDELYDQESEDEPERNESGESPRDRMKAEVKNYLNQLDFYIKKYSSISIPYINEVENAVRNKSIVIFYLNFKDSSGQDSLKNLHNALRNHIDKIDYRDFKKIFSGEDQIIATPINWIGKKKNEFVFFLYSLFEHPSIAGKTGDKRINWLAVVNCFRFRSKVIDQKKFEHNNSKPADISEIVTIISNLNS